MVASLQQRIVPHLWFDTEAREAAAFYTTIFADSKIVNTTTLEDTPSGPVNVVVFELLGQEFMAISAGPLFRFNESISFVVRCETQDEIDYYWDKPCGAGGQEVECGLLMDHFGLSLLIVPAVMDEMMRSTDPEQLRRLTRTFLKMKKFDMALLQQAFDGE